MGNNTVNVAVTWDEGRCSYKFESL